MSILPAENNKDVLQPNEQEVDLDAAWRRIRGWIYAALGLLLTAALAVSIHFQMKAGREETELAAQAMLIQAPNEGALEVVVQKYPSTDAATQARMLLAYYNYAQGDWNGARENYQAVYEQAAVRHPDLASAALFGIGMSYEAQKNFDKSIEAYHLLATRFPESFKAPESLMGEARIYEQKGDIQKARQTYENLIVKFPRSEWKNEAERRKAILSGRGS